MSYLIDTGILLRLFDRLDPAFPQIRDSINRLRKMRVRVTATSQNFAEFWNVSTRPKIARGGYGVTNELAARRIGFLLPLCEVLFEDAASFQDWRTLVVQHKVQGSKTHDARIAAIMRTNGISQIVTLNGSDFTRFPGIAVVTPADILALP